MNEGYRTPTETPVRLICESLPFYRRPNFAASLITVAGVGSIVLLLVASAVHKSSTYGSVALLMAFSAALIGSYLAIFMKRWFDGLCRYYRLALTDRIAIFTVINRFLGERREVRMPYDQIEFVNNFTLEPHPSLIFHLAGNRVVEVPIGVFRSDASPVLSLLQEKHVRLVHIE